MHKSSQEEISEILRSHKLWLERKPEGKRADFSEQDLSSANLDSANLDYKTALQLAKRLLKGKCILVA